MEEGNGEVYTRNEGVNDYEEITEEEFIAAHRAQLVSSGVPEHLWSTVYQKLTEQVYDAGQYMEVQEELNDKSTEHRMIVSCEKGLRATDPMCLFLIDHAWTFEMKYARSHLLAHSQLFKRMCSLMSVNAEDQPTEQCIEVIMRRIWRYAHTYKIRTADLPLAEAQPIWYINDEVGSWIHHSDSPNCRMVPFYFIPTGFMYTLLWLLRDIKYEEELTADQVMTTSDPKTWQARAQPWVPSDMTDVPFIQPEPDASYFESFRIQETLPDLDATYSGLPKDRNLRVFVDYQNFSSFLTDSRFEIVSSPEEADILWIQKTFKDFRSLSSTACHINQFPCEMVLTVKDLLAIVARRAADVPPSDPINPGPRWLPVTFNLETELPQFVSYYQMREKMGLDNLWICKPWNLARGMDTTVTDDLNCIVRLPETGPKVACKYVENPVLIHREDVGEVKFDIRYIVLLRSAHPLTLYAYRVFWLRFANKPFSLDSFDEYEKHFTVMNYRPDAQLKQVNYNEFIPMFEKQYPEFSWTSVEESILSMLRELFEAAVSKPPPQGIGDSPYSRAMYAVDLLLKWDERPEGDRCIVPQICEVNFGPDCQRACKYHPTFVNDIFSTLFLDDTEGRNVVQIV